MTPRLLITSDLHWNHPRSRAGAEAIIEEMNAVAHVDALLVIGDVGVADGDSIEACLSRFTFDGPKLFVPGNHELWTKRTDVDLLGDELPRRIRAIGWRWLPDEPFVHGDAAVVGALGWYDYAFADARLAIPEAFYAAKVSPGAVLYANEPAELVEAARSCGPAAQELVARWNDGKFVRLGVSDAAVVDRECARLSAQLDAIRDKRAVLAAIHTVPFAELLPPHHGGQWDFARAYLGSPRLGETLARYANVSHVVCGHSHVAAEAWVGPIRAINTGSGYRIKRFVRVDV